MMDWCAYGWQIEAMSGWDLGCSCHLRVPSTDLFRERRYGVKEGRQEVVMYPVATEPPIGCLRCALLKPQRHLVFGCW